MSEILILPPSYLASILHHWKKILLGVSIGLSIGYAAYAAIPFEWESEVVVQVGQVGQVGQQVQVMVQKGQAGQAGQPIENIQTVIQRLKSPVFIEELSRKVERPEFMDMIDKQNGGEGTLKAEKIRSSNPNSNLILLKVRANTPEMSKLKLDSVVKELNYLHAELAKEYLNMLRTALTDLEFHIEISNKLSKELDKRIYGAGCFDGIDSNITQCSILFSSKSMADKTTLEKYRFAMDIKIALSSPNTLPTHAIENATLPVRPISIGLLHKLILGALMGLISSIIWIARISEK